MAGSREYRFDGWVLSVAAGELTRPGRRIRLQRHPAEILEALLASPGELVTREALIARLWPRGVVEFDTALNTAVRRLRTALGDHAGSPRYIETIPRRGYRFIGRLEPAEIDPVPLRLAPDSGAAGSHAHQRGRTWLAVPALALLSALAAAWVAVDGPHSRVATAPAAPAPVALTALARADFLFNRRAPGDLARAQRDYEELLDGDPRLARAWAGLAGVHWIRTVSGELAPAEGLPRVQEAAERALALEPELATAHFRLFNAMSMQNQPEAARAHLRRALALGPDDPLILGVAASLAAQEGRWDEAIALQRRAAHATPLSGTAQFNLASLLFLAGRVSEAGQEISRLHATQPTTDASRELDALVAVLERRCEAALAASEALTDEGRRFQIRALALHCQGERAAAGAAMQSLVRAAGNRDPFRIAETMALLGDSDQAFHWLHRGAEVFALGVPPWAAPTARRTWMMQQSPLLSSLRDDPRWPAWLASTRVARQTAPPPGPRGG